MSAFSPALEAAKTNPMIEPSAKEVSVMLSHCARRVIANPVKKVTSELIRYLFVVIFILNFFNL